MINIPKKVEERIRAGLKEFSKILEDAKARDINETDTVTIIKDMLFSIFGYDKYKEITSEFAIRGTYCDLAVKIKEKPHLLIEVKAIGIELKTAHLRQAIDYAAKAGIDWVLLTNGICWKLNKVIFSKPVNNEVIFDIDFNNLNIRDKKEIDKIFLLTKEAADKDAISAYHRVRQLKNKYVVAAVLTSEASRNNIKKVFNLLSKEVKITEEEIYQMLINDLLKREVIESDLMKQAGFTVKRLLQKRGNKQKKEISDQVDFAPNAIDSSPIILSQENNDPPNCGEKN